MTDEHEHAMNVWWEALQAGQQDWPKPIDDRAAAAVIAADRAGLVARIAELEGVLKRCAQIVELHNWRQAEKVDDVKIIARAALGAKP